MAAALRLAGLARRSVYPWNRMGRVLGAPPKGTSKGQVTVPAEIRRQAGLLPNTEVEFVVKDGTVIIRKARGDQRRGKRLVHTLRGKAERKLTTDEIMALMRGEDS
ncbi:AbrB/MazE/SpoVT family DNA-binding domain-containing protein [Aquisalimonas sp.]|uniref:AbrB/MazE/SpoVT family DNA-binding domain-containing protein n=1 Tax=Aquisalimonas sp. TaxID=1872621 RepID=UPI0025C3190A|nr:AbrB/MazE/SpoVT family DNA-binding domain-containing protein [Aquisalimonas sp.]